MLYIPIYICIKKEKTIEETNWGKSLPEQKTKHILSAHSLESVFLFLGNTLSLSSLWIQIMVGHTHCILNSYTDETDAHTDEDDDNDEEEGIQRMKQCKTKITGRRLDEDHCGSVPHSWPKRIKAAICLSVCGMYVCEYVQSTLLSKNQTPTDFNARHWKLHDSS